METLAILQHHDAITGTSKNSTINDYLARIDKAKELNN